MESGDHTAYLWCLTRAHIQSWNGRTVLYVCYCKLSIEGSLL